MNAHKNKFFLKHSKSSAALCSLGIHGLLIVVALSFVAVTVVRKDDNSFEVKPVSRPKMRLKKLQVPVNIKKKKTQKPKLRKRIVAPPKLDQSMPDIKMPEISGVKGGMGAAAGDGLGGAGGIGFSMPEIELFGVRSRGEKIFIILDSSPKMMYDKMGGIPAYSIIKSELTRIVKSISSTTLFNIVVFDGQNSKMLFPQLVSASSDNVRLLEQWLDPLNAVSSSMSDKDYGLKTLGGGGEETGAEITSGVVTRKRAWLHPAMIAASQQADTIFLLTESWGSQTKQIANSVISRDEWYKTSDGEKWLESYEKGRQQLAEENRKRKEKGQPPRVIGSGPAEIIKAYYPGLKGPPGDTIYTYTPEDVAEALTLVSRQYHTGKANHASLSLTEKRRKKNKIDFSFNIIHFVPADRSGDGGRGSTKNFRSLANFSHGEYNAVAGLDAIEAYVSERHE